MVCTANWALYGDGALGYKERALHNTERLQEVSNDFNLTSLLTTLDRSLNGLEPRFVTCF